MMDTEALRWFAAQGATFVRVGHRAKVPLHEGWQKRGVSLAVAIAHVAQGGNIGVLIGAGSGNIVCLDADQDFALIQPLFPELTTIVIRAGVPERGKFFLRVAEPVANRSWRPESKTRPALELLGYHRQALIPPSRHPDGSLYEWRSRSALPSVSVPELEGIWDTLTATRLNDALLVAPVSPSVVPPSLSSGTARNRSIAKLKQQWPTALGVFEALGRSSPLRPAGANNLRLMGQGGLIVGHPASAIRHLWYCFADEIGGDQVDAAGYCLFGQGWHRRDKVQFKQVLARLQAAR